MYKGDIIVVLTPTMYKCKHRHTGLEHPNCYVAFLEKSKDLNVGYLDIETSNLDADFGVIFSYAIKPKGLDECDYSVITKSEIFKSDYDKWVVKDLIDDLKQYDVIYTYYGKRFDIPYIRSRALYHKLKFPMYRELYHIDLYDQAKHKLKLSSNRLANVTKFLGIKGKNSVQSRYWLKAMTGDKVSLDYILDHNIRDVEILEKFHERIKPYFARANSSI